MNVLQKYRFCFIAGLCAAGGSFFGKLPSLYKPETALLPSSWQTFGAFILYQCLPIVLMILSNILNWRYYLKALQVTEQTLIATVMTSASNYVLSFALGSLVFKEHFTLLSVLGSIFIMLGLWCLSVANQEEKEKLKSK